MKNSNDTIGNRTRDIPACTAVPQPAAPPRIPDRINALVRKESGSNYKAIPCFPLRYLEKKLRKFRKTALCHALLVTIC